jgi:DNA-binding Xre family transcriptional regulator
MAKASQAQLQNEVKAILRIAKKLLKDQRLSYRDLAKHWHLSLPAVKAAMNSENLPLSRVLSLCDLLSVSMSDLLSIVKREAGKEFRFTQEQEEFFSKNPTYLSYLFELSKKSPAEIEAAHKISPKSSRKYLKTLEKMDLVKILPDDQVKSKVRGPVLWSDHGPLGATFSKAMLLQFASWAAKKITSPEKMYLELHGWTLTPEQYREYQREYRTMAARYRDVSALNRQTLPKEKQEEISFLVLGDYWECPMFREIKEL